MDEKRFKKGDIIKADLEEAFKISYRNQPTFKSWEGDRIRYGKKPIGDLFYDKIDYTHNFIWVSAFDKEGQYICRIKIPFCCILNDNLICYSDE